MSELFDFILRGPFENKLSKPLIKTFSLIMKLSIILLTNNFIKM